MSRAAAALLTLAVSSAAFGVAARPPTIAGPARPHDVAAIYRAAAPGVVDIMVKTRASEAEGAGIVYTRRGDILTDQHVVGDAHSAIVTFADGTIERARVLGTDPSTDVAVLRVRVPAHKLHPIPLGNSGAVRVGDPVVAIGSPFGLPGTVTTGIVSAVGRSIVAPNGFTIAGAIQTDAAINPGNSGGPLLDADGRAVGLVAQIISTEMLGEGQSSGVGFATPANTVAAVADTIIAGTPPPHTVLDVLRDAAIR